MPPVPANCPLTKREFDTLALLAEGLLYKQIAAQLQLTDSTVRTHATSIFHKLDVPDRASAVMYGFHRHWFTRVDELTFEQRQMTELVAVFQRLADTALDRHGKLTLIQEDYLLAFDMMLQTPSDAAAFRLAAAINTLLTEAHVAALQLPDGWEKGDKRLIRAALDIVWDSWHRWKTDDA